jgi:hypothetical protein
MKLNEGNSTLEFRKLKLAFWELLIKNSPKGVSQPKYSIALLFNDTTDSYKH